MAEKKHCVGQNARGFPCEVVAPLFNDDRCMWHSTDGRARARRESMRAKQRVAAKRKRTKLYVAPDDLPGPLTTIDDAQRWALWIAEASLTGKIAGPTANVAANALKIFMTIEKGKMVEMQRRLNELEKLVAEARVRGLLSDE